MSHIILPLSGTSVSPAVFTIPVQTGMNYLVIDSDTGASPLQLEQVRVANNLHLSIPGSQETLVLENYYGQATESVLLGVDAGGAYIPYQADPSGYYHLGNAVAASEGEALLAEMVGGAGDVALPAAGNTIAMVGGVAALGLIAGVYSHNRGNSNEEGRDQSLAANHDALIDPIAPVPTPDPVVPVPAPVPTPDPVVPVPAPVPTPDPVVPVPAPVPTPDPVVPVPAPVPTPDPVVPVPAPVPTPDPVVPVPAPVPTPDPVVPVPAPVPTPDPVVPVPPAPINQNPSDISLSATDIAEGKDGIVIGTLTTTDPDGDTHTYTVSDNRFEIVGDELKLKSGQIIDYAREPAINLIITADDGKGGTLTKNFILNVKDDPNYPISLPNDITPPAEFIDDKGQKWVYYGGDEFNGNELDRSKWFAYGSSYREWGNAVNARYGNNMDMIQTYKDSNLSVSDGVLKITSERMQEKLFSDATKLIDGVIIPKSSGYSIEIKDIIDKQGNLLKDILDNNGNIIQDGKEHFHTGKTLQEYLDSKGVVLKVVEATAKDENGNNVQVYKIDNQNGVFRLFVDTWDSASISSKETDYLFPIFSRVDVRAKIANAEGVWHGPWMRHFNGAKIAELDLNENFVLEHARFDIENNRVGNLPADDPKGLNISTQSIHLWNSKDNVLNTNVNNGSWQERRTYVEKLAEDFHVYSVQVERVKSHDGKEMDEALITYFIDGIESYSVQTDLADGINTYNKFIKDAQHTDAEGNDRLAHGWDMIFQGGIGANLFESSHMTMGLPDESLNQVTTEIDYIRVYVKEEDAKTFAQKVEDTQGQIIKAEPGVIELYGTDADNILIGNDSGNIIRGFGGDDILIGGSGKNILIGGVGKDIFSFELGNVLDGNPDYNKSNADVITIFEKGMDKINLSSAIFEGLNADNFDQYIIIKDWGGRHGNTEVAFDKTGSAQSDSKALDVARLNGGSFLFMQTGLGLDKSDFLIDMQPII